MEPEKHSIIINGRKFFYWEKNPQKKETIILLHGFPGSHIGLVDIAQTIGNYRVIVPDLPACGQSDPLEEKHTLENYSKWLADFMEHLSLGPAIVIGHSFGSRVALSFGMHYPKRIKKMVLITPVLKVDGLIAYFMALHCNIAKLLPGYLRKQWLSNRLYHKLSHAIIFKSQDMEKRQQIKERNLKESKHVDHRVTMEIFEEFYASNLITAGYQVKVKSLIIAGDSDEIVSLSSIEEFVGGLAGAKVQIMKNSGHLLPLEEPVATSDIIQSWLE